MNGNPTAKQKDWHSWLVSHGCAISGHLNDGRLSLHHIVGSKMKLKGVKSQGEWYCICLSYWHHQDGNNPAARHVNKSQFQKFCQTSEKTLFIQAVELYEADFGHKPMTDEEYQIIVERA
jgi:hypothetical protein